MSGKVAKLKPCTKLGFNAEKVFKHLTSPKELGSCVQATSQHVAHHAKLCHGFAPLDCTRCIFASCPQDVKKAAPIPGQPGATWAEERPAFMGGAWGLGCRICAWYAKSRAPCSTKDTSEKQEFSKHRRGGRKPSIAKNSLQRLVGQGPKHQWQKERAKDPRSSVMAKFTFRKPMINRMFLQRLRQHCWQQSHMDALRAMQQASEPRGAKTDSRPAAGGRNKPATRSQQVLHRALLKGRVPKAHDWREAFVELEEQISFRKGERLGLKRKAPDDAAPTKNVRKMRRKQVGIMSEVCQGRWRRSLRRATFVSLALDGSKGKKLVRFRSDCPEAPWFSTGVLGVLDEVVFDHVDEPAEDHAQRAMWKLDLLLTQFCTPLGAPLDQDFKDHLLKLVRVVGADGCAAERRAICLAAERLFPNLLYIIRDSAHAIRIAMRDSLRHDEVFKTVWWELFDKPHALVLT